MRHSFRPETEQTLAGANVMDLLNFKMPFRGAHELGLIFVKVLLRWFYKFLRPGHKVLVFLPFYAFRFLFIALS